MRRFSNPVEYRTFTGITGSTDLTFEFYLQTLNLEVVEDVYEIILEKVPEESEYWPGFPETNTFDHSLEPVPEETCVV